jgi:hypothetical protein
MKYAQFLFFWGEKINQMKSVMKMKNEKSKQIIQKDIILCNQFRYKMTILSMSSLINNSRYIQ